MPAPREKLTDLSAARQRVRRRAVDAVDRRIVRRAQALGYSRPTRGVGIVETFTDRRIDGWVAVKPDAGPVRVSLTVGEQVVASTWAGEVLTDRANWGEVRAFHLRLRDIWSYVQKKHKLVVRVGGKALPIAGAGMYVNPKRNGRHELEELTDLMANGWLFAQGGRLQLSKKLDLDWQRSVSGLYGRIREAVRRDYGYDCFLAYGSLLGAVREGGVIGHDNDFDAGYVSKHDNGPQSAAEMHDIGLALVADGFDVECRRTALHIHDPADTDLRVDLFHFFFDEDDNFFAPFGVVSTADLGRADLGGTKEIDFCEGRVLVPEGAEKLAAHFYGPSWQVPQPGFDWDRDRRKRKWGTGFCTFEQISDVYWENAYTYRPAFDTPSSFARAVLERDAVPHTVIDIGCGDGRDTEAFARAGHTAIGVDRSRRGTATARTRDGGTYIECDVQDRERLAEIVREHRAGAALFYLRFALHAFSPADCDALFDTIGQQAQLDDEVALEFRITSGTSTRPTHQTLARRLLVPDEVIATLSERGFEVVHREDGTGLAPYGDEDPAVCRLVARRVDVR